MKRVSAGSPRYKRRERASVRSQTDKKFTTTHGFGSHAISVSARKRPQNTGAKRSRNYLSARTRWAVITRYFALGTAGIKRVTADATIFFVHLPFPNRHRLPAYTQLHHTADQTTSGRISRQGARNGSFVVARQSSFSLDHSHCSI